MALPRRSAPPAPSGPPAPSASSTSGYADVSELDKYQLISIIGKGSFGVISKVQRIEDGKEFALKQLDYAKMTDKDRKQILAEVAILESLKHRNIVQLVQKIKDPKNERIYIVMEYCTSGDLGTLIHKAKRTNTPMHEDKIWNVFLQITQALHHCHWPNERPSAQNGRLGTRLSGVSEEGAKGRCQVLHRDLKPENVFLSDDFVKLGDFGLSKDMGSAAFTSTYVGTPLYMPPEILSENKYDTKSDIWSLGCLLFEMCALSSPFAAAQTQTELITMVRSGRLPSLPSHYSPALRGLIKAMLNLNPTKRPTTKDLLELEEMRLHRKLFTVQNQASLIQARKDELRKFEESLLARQAALEQREQHVLEREREVVQREAGCNAREEEMSETQRRLNVAAEQVKAQYEKLMAERAAATAVESEAVQPASRRGSFAPVRPPLEERVTMPIATASRPRALNYDETPSKIPVPSAPLSLRRHASKSLGNLAAIARGEAAAAAAGMAAGHGVIPSYAGYPGNNEQTPAKQVAGFYSALSQAQARAAGSGVPTSIRGSRQRPGRSSIGSPGDLKKRFSNYYEDVTMASGFASPAPGPAIAGVGGSAGTGVVNGSDSVVMDSPFIKPGLLRPRKSSTVPAPVFGARTYGAGAGAGASGASSAAGSASATTAASAPALPRASASGASGSGSSSSSSGYGSGAPGPEAASAGVLVHDFAQLSTRAPTQTQIQYQYGGSGAAAAASAYGALGTPAKWMPEDPDLPSPFLRRQSTAPAAVSAYNPLGAGAERVSRVSGVVGSRERERERDRNVLGQINAQATATATATASSGVRKTVIPRSKSGTTLHRDVLKSNAGATGGAAAAAGNTAVGGEAREQREQRERERLERRAGETGSVPRGRVFGR